MKKETLTCYSPNPETQLCDTCQNVNEQDYKAYCQHCTATLKLTK